MNGGVIIRELRRHAPFTAIGTALGVALMLLVSWTGMPRGMSEAVFWSLHPLHVLLSALVTAAMYRLHSPGRPVLTALIGYIGSVGIATLSDSIIPFAGEWMLQLPHRAVHLGLIEKWWLVNPLAFLGIIIALAWPRTRFPHAAHVFLSTWASLFHMVMAMGERLTPGTVAVSTLFLFLAVWIPCCTSDIVFPLLWAKNACIIRGKGR